MKLNKAIEIGELNVKEAGKKMPADTLIALKILIEAGKVLQHGRRIGQHHDPAQLPGEDT